MAMHYDSYAGEHCGRKYMSSIAKSIDAEQKGGANQPFFKTRFVEDSYHSINFFSKACKGIGNLKSREIRELIEVLKSTEAGQSHEHGQTYHFEDDDMYQALISHPICKKVCEKQKYNDWQDIINRFM